MVVGGCATGKAASQVARVGQLVLEALEVAIATQILAEALGRVEVGESAAGGTGRGVAQTGTFQVGVNTFIRRA